MLNNNDLKKIFENLGMKINFDEISTSAPLTSVGIDSLDFFNILVEAERLTGKSVPDEDIEMLTSIDEILAYFS